MRKAKRKGQRILASALCVGMLASMVPAQVFAADEPTTAIVQQEETAADTDITENAVDAGETVAPTEAPTEAPTDESPAPTETPAEDIPEETPSVEEPVTTAEPPKEELPASTEEPSAETPPVEQTPAPTETPAVEETPAEGEDTASDTTIQAGEASDAVTTTTHIATKLGEVPAQLAGVEGVSADMFKNAFETVTVQNGDVTYTVEVIPEDTVYFIDSFSATPGTDTTPAYTAAKQLLEGQLKNETANKIYTAGSWGFESTNVSTKSTPGGSTDEQWREKKDQTGIYCDKGEETIVYHLPLEAGTYKLTSAHREWWGNQKRDLTLSIQIGDGAEQTTGTTGVLPANGTLVTKECTFTLTEAQDVVFRARRSTNAPTISWLAVECIDDAETPDASNENFGKALEETDGLLTLHTAQANGNKTDISLATDETNNCGNVLTLTGTAWNNADGGYASINNAPSYFQRSEFTLLADVNVNCNVTDSAIKGKAAAFTIGKDGNSLHIFTNDGQIGYGGQKDGVSLNNAPLTGAKSGEWNAMALTYQETETGTKVVVYLNGAKAAEIENVGFKLSDQSDLKGMICRSFGTSYLMNGHYDNIIVQDTALSEEDAEQITAERYAAKADVVTVDSIVSLNGSEVEEAAKNVNGWTYKGLGMLNGNATSNLLLDYKAENPKAYWAMMEYLFGSKDGYPLFSNIKMEMGNDGNNSTGAEACTMRYEGEDADASRSPGFVMAADAKKINPDVKVSILRWEYPNWIKNKATTQEKYEAIYKWYKETIFDAYEKYGYVIDYIDPDKNETSNPDGGIIKYFANALENEKDFPDYFTEEAKTAYNNIKIVASDENTGLKIVPLMRNDSGVYNAVDAIGFHYRTNATDDYIRMADVDDKEVWYSEGCATFGYTELQENKTISYGKGTIGGYQSPLALMDSLPNAFIGSRRTLYMFQPAIGSFYDGLQYAHKELLSARDPWSGYIHYDPALYMLAHFTQFAKTGWENETNTAGIWRAIPGATFASFGANSNAHATAGINGNASYMTLAAPDKKDFSTVFVNNTQNDKTFGIRLTDMDVSVDSLHVWTTVTDNYLQEDEPAKINNNNIAVIHVPAYSVVTATTLNTTPARFPTEEGNNGDYIQTEKRTVLDTDSTGKNPNTTDEYLYADDFEYADEPAMEQYHLDSITSTSGSTIEVPYLTARGNEPRYMLDTHGAWIVENGQLKQENASSVNQWNGGDPVTIVGDWRWMDYSASIDVTLPNAETGRYERLTIRTQTGMNWNSSGYTLEINGAGSWKLYRAGTMIFNGTVDRDFEGKYNLKLAGLGDTIYAYVDGEQVAQYTDETPMLSGRVKISSNWTQVYADNLEIKTVKGGIAYATAMIDGQDDTVKYDGNWKIDNPGGGSADDWYRTISSSSTANASFTFPINGNGFAIMGGNNGTAVIDVYVDDVLTAQGATTKAAPTRGEAYILSDLPAGQHTIRVVLQSGTLRIDALNTIGPRSEGETVENPAVSVESAADIAYSVTGTTLEELRKQLPETVNVTFEDGSVEAMPVTWDVDEYALNVNGFGSARIIGKVAGARNKMGGQMMTTIRVNEVIPSNTVYFIDLGYLGTQNTSEPYKAYRDLLGGQCQLLNDTFDQRKTDANGWGIVTSDAKNYSSATSADKYETGIFGKNNAKGEKLTYALTLPAGNYTLVSGHREWWNGRSMAVVVRDTAGNALSDTINISVPNDASPRLNFALAEETTVQYVVTSTTGQAPVMSWLAVYSTPTDKVVLDKVIKDNDNKIKDDYTEDSWTKFEEALKVAKAVQAKEDAIQDAVDAAVGPLKEAAKNLKRVVVKDKLAEAIDANTGKTKDEYTEDSWKNFEDALTAAKDIQQKADATQAEVDAAAKALTEAAAKLEKKSDPTEKPTAEPTATPEPTAKPTESPKPTATPAPTQTPGNTSKPGNNASGSNNTSGNGSATSSNTSSPVGTAQPSTATPAPAKTIPQTSDSFPVVPLAALAVLSLGGLIVLFLRRKARK